MKTPPSSRADIVVALLAMAAGIFALTVWIPMDSDSGLYEIVRRRLRIGDALGPSVAAVFVVVGGALMLVRRVPSPARVAKDNLRFLAMMLALLAVCFALMRWTGPLAVAAYDALTGADLTYRNLRDTAPWKYLGFLSGGILLVFVLISLGARRMSWRSLCIAVGAVLALIALYDLPFDDLLLPPNGDV